MKICMTVLPMQAKSVLFGRADPGFPATNEKRPVNESPRLGYGSSLHSMSPSPLPLPLSSV